MTNRRYQGKYHYSVPSGWMNDPNGCVFFQEKYHIFYQSNPHKPFPERVGWGHVVTEDFVHFERLPEALVPEFPYENIGCWSGNALVDNGTLYLMYTGNGDGIQQQCLAYSQDGISFEKDKNNPVLRSDSLPDHCDIRAWRDPFMFQFGGEKYLITGARDPRGFGKVLTFKALDFSHWSYVGEFAKSNMMANPGIFECPNLALLSEDKQIFVSSVNFVRQKGKKYQNFTTTIGSIGKFVPETGRFVGKKKQELDAGFDYYAPQVMHAPDGRAILIGWMQNWERSYPTQNDGWVGSLALPRVLEIKGSHIYQYPPKELLQKQVPYMHRDNVSKEDVLSLPSSCQVAFDLDFDAEDKVEVSVFNDGVHETRLIFDKAKNEVVFDRTQSGLKVEYSHKLDSQSDVRYLDYVFGKRVHVDIFLDVSSVELFLDYGKAVMTGTVFPDESEDYEFGLSGGVASSFDVSIFQ